MEFYLGKEKTRTCQEIMHNEKVVRLMDFYFYFPVGSKDYIWSHVLKGNKLKRWKEVVREWDA